MSAQSTEWKRFFMSNEEVFSLTMVGSKPYLLNKSPHLYARGPLLICSVPSPERTPGILDLAAFFNASYDDADGWMKAMLQTSVLNIFSDTLFNSTVGRQDSDVLIRNLTKTFKQVAIIAHCTKALCQQHFKLRFGAIMDNFLALHSCRRLVEFTDDFQIPKRQSLFDALAKLAKNDQDVSNFLLQAGLEAAIAENDSIDEAKKKATSESDVDHQLPDQKSEKFPMLNGFPYRHPGVPQRSGATLCTDYHVKDRAQGDIVESSNHAIGADTHRKMLLSGCQNGASLFGSLLITRDALLGLKYEEIASHFRSGLTLSLQHLRNCPIAFHGRLCYFNEQHQRVGAEVQSHLEPPAEDN
jgi:hypothetical protein